MDYKRRIAIIFFSSDNHHDHKNIIKFDKRPDVDIVAMNERIIRVTNEHVGEKDIFVYLGDFLLNKELPRDDGQAYADRVAFFLDQLRCKNIIFVGGNHDLTYIRRHGVYIPNWPFWELFQYFDCTKCNALFDPKRRFGLPKTCNKDCSAYAHALYNLHPMGYELRLTRKICSEQNIPFEYDGMMIVCTHYSHRVWNKSHHSRDLVGRSINLYGHSHGGLPGIRNSFDVGFNIWNRPLSLVEILTKLMPEHNKTQNGEVYFGHHEGNP